MRLRPSGRQGPVATSLDAFRALPDGRGLDLGTSRPDPRPCRCRRRRLAEDVETVRREVLAARTEPGKIVADTAEMRARIFAAKAPDGEWEAKIGPGRLRTSNFWHSPSHCALPIRRDGSNSSFAPAPAPG